MNNVTFFTAFFKSGQQLRVSLRRDYTVKIPKSHQLAQQQGLQGAAQIGDGVRGALQSPCLTAEHHFRFFHSRSKCDRREKQLPPEGVGGWLGRLHFPRDRGGRGRSADVTGNGSWTFHWCEWSELGATKMVEY